MTSLQEVVDGVREAQEVVRNLQHNAGDLHKNLKVALEKRGKMRVRVAETQGKLREAHEKVKRCTPARDRRDV